MPESQAKGERTPRSKRRFRWRRWALGVLGLVLLAEFLLRVLFGFGHPLLYQRDAAWGYLPKPSQDITRFSHRNYVNARGMRSAEFTMPRPAQTLRILFLGDSVTYGTTFVNQDQIFTERLLKILPGAVHKPVEVLNVSAGGWAPGNEFAWLKANGTFESNIVLFVWNTPDPIQPFSPFAPSASFPEANPWTAIGEVWSRYVMPRLFRGSAPPPDPGSTASTQSDDAGQIAKNLELLAQAQAIARASGATLGLVYVPSPGREFQIPSLDRAHQQVIDWTKDHGIPLLDLSDAFHSHGWQALAFEDGIHLRPQGHELVEQELTAHWATTFGAAAQSQVAPPK